MKRAKISWLTKLRRLPFETWMLLCAGKAIVRAVTCPETTVFPRMAGFGSDISWEFFHTVVDSIDVDPYHEFILASGHLFAKE